MGQSRVSIGGVRPSDPRVMTGQMRRRLTRDIYPMELMGSYSGDPSWGPSPTAQSDIDVMYSRSGPAALYTRRKDTTPRMFRTRFSTTSPPRYTPDHGGIPFLQVRIARSQYWANDADEWSKNFGGEMFWSMVWLLQHIGAQVLDVVRQYCATTVYTLEQLRKFTPYRAAGSGRHRRMASGRRALLKSRAPAVVRAMQQKRGEGAVPLQTGRAASLQQTALISPRTGWFLAGWQPRISANPQTQTASLYMVNTRRVGNGKYLQELFWSGTSHMVPRPIHTVAMRALEGFRSLFRPLNLLMATFGSRKPRGMGRASEAVAVDKWGAPLAISDAKANLRQMGRAVEQAAGQNAAGRFHTMSQQYDPFAHAAEGVPAGYRYQKYAADVRAQAVDGMRRLDQWTRQVLQAATAFTHGKQLQGRGTARAMAEEMQRSQAAHMQRLVQHSLRGDEGLIYGYALRQTRGKQQRAIARDLTRMSPSELNEMIRRSGLSTTTYVGVWKAAG